MAAFEGAAQDNAITEDGIVKEISNVKEFEKA